MSTNHEELTRKLPGRLLTDISIIAATVKEKNVHVAFRMVDRNPIFLHFDEKVLEFSDSGDSFGPSLNWREMDCVELPPPIYEGEEDDPNSDDLRYIQYSIFDFIAGPCAKTEIRILSGELTLGGISEDSIRGLRLFMSNEISLSIDPFCIDGLQLYICDRRPILDWGMKNLQLIKF